MPTDADTRSKGAHYLDADHHAVVEFVKAAALKPGETVLDAGAGRGALTGRICDAVAPGGTVVAVETQQDLVFRLKRLAKPGLQVIQGDILAVRLPVPLDAVVANPPYRILPAILRRLLAHGFGRAVLVVPLELAERLVAQPKSDNYGRLTIEIAMQAKVERLFAMPKRAFDPVPAVASVVIRVTPKPGRPMDGIDAKVLDHVLDAAWDGRTKTLRHALSPLDKVLGVPPQDISEALAMVNGQERRFTEVSPWEWSVVAKHLSACTEARKAARTAVKDARKESERVARREADLARAPKADDVADADLN
ncbi:MAG: rRNA adenine dimethyltransferase family protein [Candidatus Thermoplasmatota archaeon]